MFRPMFVDQYPVRTAGTVKFVGQTTFSKGKWIGIELAENMGKNDGADDGHAVIEPSLSLQTHTLSSLQP